MWRNGWKTFRSSAGEALQAAGLRDCIGGPPAPDSAPEPMTRSVCCLALTCLFAACAPEKALLVEETPVTPPKKESKPAAGETEEPADVPRVVNQQSGMMLPDVVKLPEQRDMVPTANPANPAGGRGAVTATPPTGDKPASE